MIKDKGFIYTIKYYRIIQLVILGAILYSCQGYFLQFLCFISHVDYRSNFYELFEFLTPITLLALWFFISFSVLRERSYFYKTGRSYYGDESRYKRTYYELLEYFEDADPNRLNTEDFPKQHWQDTKGIIIGMDGKKIISLPSNTEGNFAVFGPPGAGKTAGLVNINSITFSGSVLAVDIKGDIYNYVSSHSNRKIYRFCPDVPNALQESCHFDPLAGIETMDITDQKLFIESMATVLIPDDGGSDGNYFSSRARKMFQGITFLHLHENPNTSFPTIIHSILEGNIFDWVKKAMSSDCTPARELLLSFYGNSEKNVSSAYDALTTALVNFSNPLLDELLTKNGKCISIDMLERGCDVYLQISQEHLDAYAPLFTLILQSFSTAFTKRPDSAITKGIRPILVILDEFAQLTFSYKLINSNLSTLRSKSIIFMLIQQNMAQLEHRYKMEGARSIIGNCNYQIILGSNDTPSSKMFSDMFGTRKVLKISSSLNHTSNSNSSSGTSSGKSVQEAREKIFEPEHFGNLPANKKMVVYFKGQYIECTKLNCYTDIKRR